MDYTQTIYYIQTNFMCICLLVYMFVMHLSYHSTESWTFRILISIVIVYCVADIVSWVAHGQFFTGARVLLYLSNMLFISLPMPLVIFYSRYVGLRLKGTSYKTSTVTVILSTIDFVCALLVFTTPFTGFAFTIDEGNIYHRAIGAYIMPIVCMIHAAFITVQVIRAFAKAQTMQERENVKPLLFFLIPPLICGILQVLVYGITVSQVGFTFGGMVLYFYRQYTQISCDELTGLNNRREYDSYLHFLRMGSGTDILYCMLDIDHFKLINDRFGHQEGDRYLQATAQVLKDACGHIDSRLFLARYGGDEFVIIGRNGTEDMAKDLELAITYELGALNAKGDLPAELQFSFGIACGRIKDNDSVQSLIKEADAAMYSRKGTAISK